MIGHFLKISFRSLLRHRSLSFINMLGLAVSLACCIQIGIYVSDELSYDRFHPDADRIHRVVKDFVNDDGTSLPDATTPPALAIAMNSSIPEVEQITRVFPGWGNKYLFRYEEKSFLEEKVFRVDSSFFKVFNFPFVQGDHIDPFRELNSVVLTESMALKYFGRNDAIGKVLSTDLGNLKVTGILKDVPVHSHFHFDFLISIKKIGSEINTNWDFYNFYTYVKFKPNTQVALIEAKIQDLYKNAEPQGTNIFYTQPLKDIHLHSELKWELEPNGDILYIYVFSLIALFVILIAFMNYVNLTTARSSLRVREIGIRKVSGAVRTALIAQFLSESVLTAFLAWVIALPLAYAATPLMYELTLKQIDWASMSTAFVLVASLLVTLFFGLLAGIYPALLLSSFRPITVLKGIKWNTNSPVSLRKALVITQFTISIAMIASTLVVVRQLDYLQNTKLGLNKDQVLVVQDAGNSGNYAGLKNELNKIPGVLKVAMADGMLGGQNWTNSIRSQGSDNGLLLNYLTIDHEFLDLMDIRIKGGRGFSNQFLADTLQNGLAGTTQRKSGGIILNETAVKNLGIAEPVIGKEIVWGEDADTTYNLAIVGVVKDFHYTTFRSEIKPFAFVFEPRRQGLLTLKMDAKHIQKSLTQIESTWKTFSPGRPFQYTFLDETFATLYQSEDRFKKIFTYITLLAILVSCLGLFALTSFVTTQRTKEIGIRKVLGASVGSIASLLTRDFIRLILVAVLIASPLAWWAMNQWLKDYAYRTEIDWKIFLVSAGFAFFIALATISTLAIKAALVNPARSLRTE